MRDRIYRTEYAPSMGSLFSAKFSEFEIEEHENANDIDEHGKGRTRKACSPCKDNLIDRQLTKKEAIPFLRV
jgi:hypothetical protein